MRFLNQNENSRFKLVSSINSSNDSSSNNEQQSSTNQPEIRTSCRYSAIDILARLFPNQKRNVMELVLQGCNGDALKTIDYFLSLSDNLASNGIKTINQTSTKPTTTLTKPNNQPNQQQQNKTLVTSKKAHHQTKLQQEAKSTFNLRNPNQNSNSISKSDSAIKRLTTSSAFSPLIKRNLIKDHLNSSLSSNLSTNNSSLNVYNSSTDNDSMNKSTALINPLRFSIDSATNSIPPMANYLHTASPTNSLASSLTNYSSLSANPINLFNSSKPNQPMNANLNQQFLLNNSLSKSTGVHTAINPLLNSIRVSSNNSSLCSTPLSDGQQCSVGTNCTSCSTSINNLANSLLNQQSHSNTRSTDGLSSVQIYSQHLNPFNSSLIDFTFNSSPAAIASFLLKNNCTNSRFYRNSMDVMDLSNANCDTPSSLDSQLHFKPIQSTSTK